MAEPILTDAEFAKLPTRQQLTVLYRTMRGETSNVSKMRFHLKLLSASQAAMWMVIVWIIKTLKFGG